MKILASGIFFVAAALTDLALNQIGSHNLMVKAPILQVIAIILLIAGILESLQKRKERESDQSKEKSHTKPFN